MDGKDGANWGFCLRVQLFSLPANNEKEVFCLTSPSIVKVI
jgi:hypothetical protein